MSAKPSLNIPTRIYYGVGRLEDLPGIVKEYGGKVLMVTGPSPLLDLAREQVARLEENGVVVNVMPVVTGEPTLAMVRAVIDKVRANGAEVLIGFGGGSAMDTAKAAAAIAPTGRPVTEFFTGSGPMEPGLPWIAVPTTSGSGAEVTPNAVLIELSSHIKQSIRGPRMAASAAVVDPAATLLLPPLQTVYSGMDAISHAIEAYTSKGANELTDLLALEAARLIWLNLPRAFEDGRDLEARAAMSRASLMAGMALANARLGAVHGLAHPVGSLYRAPHGLVCAILLPQVMRFNLRVACEKYARLAEVWGLEVSGSILDRAVGAVDHLISFEGRFGIPSSLAALDLSGDDIEWIVNMTLPSGSLAANPRAAGRGELVSLLRGNLY